MESKPDGVADPDPDAASARTRRRIGVTITIVAVLIALVHAIFPRVAVDATTLGLLCVAALPWLFPFLKSAKLPGGLEVEFREFQRQVKEQLHDGVQRVEEVASRVERVVEQFSITGPAAKSTVEALNQALSDYHDYLKGVGFDVADKPSVELRDGVDSIAYYDPASRRIVMETRYAAERDLAYREYSHHALLGALGDPQLDEAQSGLESGLADYFLCSFKNEPIVGAAIAADLRRKGEWDKPALRDLSRPLRFTRTRRDASPQEVGEIWGGAFWAIRGLLGRDATDRLLLQAWKEGRARPDTFAQTVVAVLKPTAAPKQVEEVEAIFRQHGAWKS